jgi:hypothetical protein
VLTEDLYHGSWTAAAGIVRTRVALARPFRWQTPTIRKSGGRRPPGQTLKAMECARSHCGLRDRRAEQAKKISSGTIDAGAQVREENDVISLP